MCRYDADLEPASVLPKKSLPSSGKQNSEIFSMRGFSPCGYLKKIVGDGDDIESSSNCVKSSLSMTNRSNIFCFDSNSPSASGILP